MFMTFKEFKNWVKTMTIYGYFNKDTASYCNDVIEYIKVKPFWKRNKVFKTEFKMEKVGDNYIPIKKDFIELKNKYLKGDE